MSTKKMILSTLVPFILTILAMPWFIKFLHWYFSWVLPMN